MHALLYPRLPARSWITALCLSAGGVFGLASCAGNGANTTNGANDSGVTSNGDDDDDDDDDDNDDDGRDSGGNNDSSPASSGEAGSGVTTEGPGTSTTVGTSTTTSGATTSTSNPDDSTTTETNTSDPGGTMETGDVECNASAAPSITQLGLETVVQSDDFTILVYAAQPPGSEDWYLVDALGYVRVFSGGVLQPTPFLDVSSEVQNSTFTGQGVPTGGGSNYDERGLLSIVFAPDYATSGKSYVTLIPTSGDAMDHDLVLEYTRSAENPLVADTSTRRAILDLEPGGVGYSPGGSAPNLAKYHNASTALFGPDGMLYVGMGDGGGECNSARPGLPQDVSSPYGKILRLDPNAAPPYAAAGNPFADSGDARVLHWGIRNPFRFSFDSLTGDFYFGDVGQWNHEEISFAPAGAQGLNFGWPDYESVNAESCVTNITLASGATHTPPVFDLPHTMPGAANLLTTIVGGAVYRGTAIRDLYGAYLFAEFYPNRPFRALYQCGDQTSDVTVIQKVCDPNTPNAACFMPAGGTSLSVVAAIVEGNDGELYLAANGNALMKIVPAQ